MDKKQAHEIIRKTFESPFEKDRFIFFIKNLLNKIDQTSFIYRGNYIPEAYREYISTLERVGKFNGGQNSIDILIVKLKRETSLERARTKQRNFIAWYLNGSRGNTMKDAALVAFVSPGKQQDWRFSLVKMDYRFEKKKSGKVKVKEEFTPARRWSFLVGANERSHTAQSRLVKILKNDEQSPTLLELEKAFDIETVTKEFFLKYRELFIRTKEELDKIVKADKKVKSDFESKGINTVDFAKKLLGQIVFLYFLQKKGWFGVERDKAWGTGSKRFLRELFEKKHGDYKNFFNDTLEPLFYDALSRDRSDIDHWNDHFKCKIPFLNGGLFDPIGGYSWHKTDIFLSDELFSNGITTKEGDRGNGILDVFDRYNFTVKEDEPLEKEVAIDPELLGKAYEKFNAIRPDNFEEYKKALKTGSENRFNKKFGVYYTPREIVHYMCQQSLINYLVTELDEKVSKSDIETLIEQGELLAENEAIALQKEQLIATGQQKIAKNKSFLSKSIADNAELIDKKLKEITVCDPAVGSGAFPVGMMSLIIKTRNLLSLFINDNYRAIYDFKRQCIEKSLYGVDIDPGAVEIAKLRLWLSLVVDEQDVKNIKPLPNLDYRIMQGNSLISEFMGINFDSDKKSHSNLTFKDKVDELVEDFQQKKDRFLNEPNTTRKQRLKKEIDELLVTIFETKLKRQKSRYFKDLKRIKENSSRFSQKKQRENYIKQEKDKLYKKTGFNLEATEKQLEEFTSGKKIRPFFLWGIYFSEVFHNKGGFDIVIANPPYLRIQEIQKNTPQLAKQLKTAFFSANGSFDIYACFVEQAVKIIRAEGNIVFILPHKFFQAAFGKNLRQLLSTKRMLRKVVDFGSSQVFETATTYTCLLFLSYQNNHFEFAELKSITTVDDLPSVFKYIDTCKQGETDKVATTILLNKNVNEKEWHFSAGNATRIVARLQLQSRRLSDVCEKIFQGIATGADRIYFLEYISERDGVVYAYSKSLEKKIQIEKDFVKPLLKGADVHRYCKLFPRISCVFPYKIANGKAILFSQNEIKKKFPMAWKYLLQHKKVLGNREKGRFKKQWWCFSRPQNLTEFNKTKIVTPDIAGDCQMALDDNGLYHTTTIYSFILKSNIESITYYLALLNSKLLWYFLTSTGSVLRGNFFRFKTNYLMPFPIPSELSEAEQQPFISLVKNILAITKDGDYLENSAKQAKVHKYEKQIDQMFYELYGLTKEEIKIVENSMDWKSEKVNKKY